MIREPCRFPNWVAHFYAADNTLKWRRSSRKFFCAERRADQKQLTAMKIYSVRCRSTHWGAFLLREPCRAESSTQNARCQAFRWKSFKSPLRSLRVAARRSPQLERPGRGSAVCADGKRSKFEFCDSNHICLAADRECTSQAISEHP